MIIYDTLLNENKIPELVVREEISSTTDFQYNNTQLIADMMRNVFNIHKKTEEYVYLLCFDTKFHLMGIFELSHGTVDYSLVSAREYYMKALLCGAVSTVIVHNHPSGDASPSKADFELTNRLKKAGELLGISLADSIVIGGNTQNSIQSEK